MEAYVTHTHTLTVQGGAGWSATGGDDNAHSTLRKTLMLCTRSRCSTPMTLVLYMILYDYMILHIYADT